MQFQLKVKACSLQDKQAIQQVINLGAIWLQRINERTQDESEFNDQTAFNFWTNCQYLGAIIFSISSDIIYQQNLQQNLIVLV